MKPNGNIERRRNTPVDYPRTRRPDFGGGNTSARAGKVYPAGFIPLMPEDAIAAGSSAVVAVKMEPTSKTLANPVRLRLDAYFVSYAALDRFDGMDSVTFGWAEKAGAPAIVDTATYAHATHGPLYQAAGIHLPEGVTFNTLYHRAYNQVVNYRRQVVSESLAQRLETDCTLARALWGDTALGRVVPDFDAALIEASAQLTFNSSLLPIRGLGLADSMSATAMAANAQARESDGTSQMYPAKVDGEHLKVEVVDDRSGATGEIYPQIFAELAGDAGTISLAAIDQARKLKSFAQLRAQMAGTDEELIDLLMRGMQIPRAAYQNPMHMGSGTAVIGQQPRYATDAANLDVYVADGGGVVQVPLYLPKQDTGGCVVITYEIVPEPVFDRQADLFLHKSLVELPNALRDYLDVQPVSVVPNRFVDALHSNPTGTFGYAPLNHDWARRRIWAGGRFFRDGTALTTDEDQQYVWSVTSVDPVLDEDSFLVPADLSHDVFFDATIDPFRVRCIHNAVVEGITQFGPALYESTGDFEAVVSEMDDTVIVPPSAAV